MAPALRLILAVTTLTAFWFALFVATPPPRASTTASAVPPPPAVSSPAEADRDSASVDALLAASRDAYTRGRWAEALGPTEALVTRFPGQHVHLSRLAEIYRRLERPREEAATWERFMNQAPLPAEACPQIGYAYRKLKMPGKALAAFERCLKADSTNTELVFFVGLANEWLTRFGPAEEHYRRAIDMATIHYDSEVGLARIGLHRNQLGEALSRAMTVLEKVPAHVDALVVAGLAEQRLGHRSEARGHLEQAETLGDTYFDVQLALGVLDYSESNYASARRRFETAARADASRRDEVSPWLERTAHVRSAS